MKKELFYQAVFKANNHRGGLRIMFIIFELAQHLIYPFTRKNLGERKFSFELLIFLCVALAVFHVVSGPALQKLSYSISGDFRDLRELSHFSYLKYIFKNITWYIFLGLIIYFGNQRYQEIKRLPSVFDFGRFTYARGEVDARLYDFHWKGKPVTQRMVDIIIEPGVFLLLGISLIVLHQMVGFLIILASLLTSLENKISYVMGDHYIMDKIDSLILSEELQAVFVEGKSPKDTRGVAMYGNPPSDKNNRISFINSVADDDVVTVK